jgi:hypothetical protein
MNPPPAAPSRAHRETRDPETIPTRTRDNLVQRVLIARKRLPQAPANPLAKSR